MELPKSAAGEADHPPTSAFSMPLQSRPASSVPAQEDEEWDYEYSNTETEVSSEIPNT